MNFQDTGIFGFDVSFYQDVNATVKKIDFQMMKDYGASFAVIKAGQFTYADEDFADNWRNCKGILPRSAYWFGDKDATGKSQAIRFWALVQNDQPEGMLFVDYEDGSWVDWRQLYDFIVELQTLSGYPSSRIGIYTGRYYWIDHSPVNPAQRDWFKPYPLWIAWYADDPTVVRIPLPWIECLLWQDGTPSIGFAVGVESREVDHNRFNGDAEKFKTYMGGTPVVPPDGGEMTLYYADLKAGYESNVRPQPDLQSGLVEVITGPLTVSIVSEKTTADGYDWYKIDSPTVGWIAMTTSYTNFRQAGNPTVPNTMEVTLKLPDGTLYKGTVNKQ